MSAPLRTAQRGNFSLLMQRAVWDGWRSMHKNKKSRKRPRLDSNKRIGAEYLIFPLVFCVLLCAVCTPLLYGGFQYARQALISAQQSSLAATDHDVQTLVTYGEAQTTLPNTPVAEGYARLTCSGARVDTLVYYGFNRASLREGAAQLPNAKIGSGQLALVGGYASGVFSSLPDAAAGDRVAVSTNDRTYDYTVSFTVVLAQDDLADFDLQAKDDRLILFTTYPSGVFATNTDQLFCVVCVPQSETEVSP